MREDSACMEDKMQKNLENLENYIEYRRKRNIIEKMQQTQTPEKIKNNHQQNKRNKKIHYNQTQNEKSSYKQEQPKNNIIQHIEEKIIQQSSSESDAEKSGIEKSNDEHLNKMKQKMDPKDILEEYRKNIQMQRIKQQKYENQQNRMAISTQCMTITIMLIMIVKMFIDLRIISA